MNETSHSNWNVITPSAFPWEKEALDFIRQQFPSHEPYRAWSNFEFIADDGSLNEVDLLVFGPMGFFLIEIKSRPGLISGDAHTWNWQHENRTSVLDNPIYLANKKAKKLASLLQRQRAFDKSRVPFIEPLIFCSAENLQLQLQGNGRFHVCLRDRDDRPGIMAAIKSRKCPGLSEQPRGTFDKPMAKTVSRAVEQVGIKRSNQSRKVGDYELQAMLDEGLGYQDFLGKHVALDNSFRRIRIYPVQSESNHEQRAMLQRAAEREFRLLQTLEHQGVLKAKEYTNHELGPSIIFEHFPTAIRLDHYLIEFKDKMTDDLRLSLMRQIAETMVFAHGKHVVHRNLSPRSILVVNPESANPKTVLMNWQLGYRQAAGGNTLITKEVTATIHVDRLAEETTKVFMAPETLIDGESLGEHHDIFSLGAVCYQLFTGQPPADNTLALAEKLRVHRGLRVSAVVNGAPESLDELVQYSTDPDVSNRLDTAADFLELLEKVEDELTTPSNQLVGDPTQAKPGDILPGGYEVIRKLGTGSTATAILVCKDNQHLVAKIAVDAAHNSRVRDEGEVLGKLNSPLFVRCHDIVQFADRTALILDPAGDIELDPNNKRKATTLGQRIREEGRLSLDLAQRFGEDLLEAVVVLEREGIAHRDLKPDNIGVSRVGRGDALHLVIFDFSLSRFGPENIRAGTPGYLDPFLSLRKPPRWDLQAERFSAGITLYQMVTGSLPVWHDGKSDPALVDCEVTIDAEQFYPNLRDEFTEFFRRALRRNPRERFDNAQQMLEGWQRIFSTSTLTLTGSGDGEEPDNSALLAAATTDTNIAELGLGPAATDALDRINVVKVRDLLHIWGRRLARMRGVGNKTRKRILATVKGLRERLGATATGDNEAMQTDGDQEYDSKIPIEQMSIDMLTHRILRTKSKSRNATETTALEALLGLDQRIDHVWPSHSEIAPLAGVTRGRVSQILSEAQTRWAKDPAITVLREQIASLLDSSGGVMSADELSESLLTVRGSLEEDPLRTRRARVVTRAAVETENFRQEPKFIIRRIGANALISIDMSLADYAVALGQCADKIASEDPLVPPARVIEMLREVPLPPEAEPLGDARLLRLAAAASQSAAISSRQELYPRGMDVIRAIRLSHGGLVGVRSLTPSQIRQRVNSRYPQAAPLPERSQLTRLLIEAGLELKWDEDHPGGGAYVSTARNVLSISNVTHTPSRYQTIRKPSGVPTPQFPPSVSPELAEARAFEERLRYSEKHGSFLALTVRPILYDRAREELTSRFDTTPLDLEGIFLDALHDAATEVGADWNVVVNADAADPKSDDWRNLNHLIASNVIPRVEQAIIDGPAGKTVFAYHLNWLQRYGQVVMLTRIARAVHQSQVHGVWLLIPATPPNTMPILDGAAVPVITSNQWAHIPESWCKNEHRTDIKKISNDPSSTYADATSADLNERSPTP